MHETKGATMAGTTPGLAIGIGHGNDGLGLNIVGEQK